MSCACASSKRYKINLIDIIKHNDETVSFDFKSDHINTWAEGDSSKLYVNLQGQEVGKKFSYATISEETRIRFTTRIRTERSDYKDRLSTLSIGDTVEITEPQGDFKLMRHNRPVVLLSNGVGIATSRSLIKTYQTDPTDIPALIQINVDGSGTIYKDEFDNLMGQLKTFKSYYTSNRKAYYQRLDAEIQNILFDFYEEPYVYIVGSANFVIESMRHLKDVGFQDDDIITDGHVETDGACGCSTTEGCGCGSNTISSIIRPDMYVLPVVNLS